MIRALFFNGSLIPQYIFSSRIISFQCENEKKNFHFNKIKKKNTYFTFTIIIISSLWNIIIRKAKKEKSHKDNNIHSCW
jgi:hypothetical protein